MCGALLGIYLEIYFEGRGMAGGDAELCKEEIKVVLATGSPADFNPILSFTVDLVKRQQENFLLMLGFGQAASGLNSVQDFQWCDYRDRT